MRLLSAAVPQVKEPTKKYFTLRLRRRPYYFFTPPIEREKSREISPFKNFTCLSNYAIPQVSSEKRVQASDPEDPTLCRHLLHYEFQPMSDELSDTDVCSVGNGLALSTCTREPIHLNALKERPSRLYWRRTGRGRVRKHLKSFLRRIRD